MVYRTIKQRELLDWTKIGGRKLYFSETLETKPKKEMKW